MDRLTRKIRDIRTRYVYSNIVWFLYSLCGLPIISPFHSYALLLRFSLSSSVLVVHTTATQVMGNFSSNDSNGNENVSLE